MRRPRLPIVDVETHVPASITAVRRSAGWRGLFLQERRGSAGDVNYLGGPRQHLLYLFCNAVRSEVIFDDVVTRTVAYKRGELRFTPAGHSVAFRWTGQVEVLILGMEPWFLESIAAELGAAIAFDRELSLRKLPATHATSALMQQIGDELAAQPGGSLIAEGLARAIGVHLLREFAAVPAAKPTDAAPPYAVLRAVELMRERLAVGLSLDEMAGQTGVSPFHFARLFKAATGHPPHEYLIRLRVDRAQELISRHGRTHTMAAIAQESGFADQSHMTRHFRRVLGVTPGEFAEAQRGG
jgi:AraC family transcriptional regulator